MRYTMRQTCVPTNTRRSTKLHGTQRSPELAFRSIDFCIPENQIFPVLKIIREVNDKLKEKCQLNKL